MDLIHVNVNEKVFTPAHKTDLNKNLVNVRCAGRGSKDVQRYVGRHSRRS
jgi:hypothetical protein